MPNLLDLLLDPISLTVFGLYAGLIAWEWAAPARILPAVKGWRWRGLSAFAAYFLIASYLPILWSEQLARYRLVDLTVLGTLGGAAVGLLVYELAVYFWHRTMHRYEPLWRAFHQMHHSAERLDTFGAFYFSPLDMASWTFLSSLCLSTLGISAQATTLFLLATTFLSIFQHANIRTPRWLGYLVQRPESHTVHHNRGVHAYNYSDLPIFDLMFGTLRNPAHFAGDTGFYGGASRRIRDMLLLRDVSKPKLASPVDRTGACRHFHQS